MVVVLAVGAHPDDIELGCGGSLALFKMNGHKVFKLVLTGGEGAGNPDRRKDECRNASEALGVDGLYFGGLVDTMVTDGIETIQAIERVIDEVKPDIVFTHTFRDTHQDHRNTGYATLSAARRCGKILMYEGPRTSREFVPQVFLDIEKTIETKKRVTRLFNSQTEKYYLRVEAIEGLARHRGYQCGATFAEAFEVGKLVLAVEEFCSPAKEVSEAHT